MGLLNTNKDRRGTLWPVKCLRFNQVPAIYREPFIFTRYRSCRSSITSCIVSVSCLTNETLNFWTHFVPFLIFLVVTLQYAVDYAFVVDPFNWPMMVFLVSICLYTLGSSMAHMFNSLSEVAYYICFFIDYGTVSIYIMGLSIAYNAYAFPPSLLNSIAHRIYLPMVFLLSLVFSATSCMSRLSRFAALRVHGRKITFPAYYIWCNMPLFYRAFYGSGPLPVTSSASSPALAMADSHHITHGLFALATVVTYGTHFPEVFAPGRFDFIAHSHQLFHLSTVGLTYYQYSALLVEMKERRRDLEARCGSPTFDNTFLPFLADSFLQMVMIGYLAVWLMKPRQIIRIKHAQGVPTVPLKQE
ncbi:membrane progestin receptor gamma-like [Diadema setosum]|uniref:membrane progestin receptor gamma-like n=1 Tax=Diadema setosum TaxID=31175 RepID=UPI003B3BD837